MSRFYVMALIFFLALAQLGQAGVITVGASGANQTTIQAAIDAAGAGDTVQINAGTYNEAISLAGKSNLILTTAPNADVTIAAPAGLDTVHLESTTDITTVAFSWPHRRAGRTGTQ